MPPSLDNTFGAFLLATFLGLVLYGLTLHQSYRYVRLFPNDAKSLKAIVALTVILETFHSVLCMHTCYYYLVTHYFDPTALLDGVWSIRISPISTALVVLLSEGFYARRVYYVGTRYRTIVLIVPILMLAVLGFATAASIEAFIRPTFADFGKVAWTTSAGFGAAVAIDLLLTGTLTITLHKSRTGFKRTDSLIDVLIIYTINTGLVTGIFSVLSLIFALVAPNNMIYSAFNLIATKCYANSVLAVLNSRKTITGKIGEDCFNTGSFALSTLQRSGFEQLSSANKRNVHQVSSPCVNLLRRAIVGVDTSRLMQLPEIRTGTSSTVVDIGMQSKVTVLAQDDEDRVNTEGLVSK
ncbi:hypothetical protein C8Q73DRAFT_432890 [Cubamyces lactineus]|nr:hypothetical protein C8Q73DRAFT_432890 [Cubamyces lactineus]